MKALHFKICKKTMPLIMKKIIIYFLFPFLSLAQGKLSTISSNSPLVLDRPDFFKDSEGIQLLAEGSDKSNFTYSIKLTNPELFYSFDMINERFYYFFLLPGDNVKIQQLPTGELFLSGPNNNDYFFLEELQKVNSGILYQADSRNASLILDTRQALINASQTGFKRDSLLAIYQPKIRLEVYKLYKTAFYLKKLDFLLEPYNPSSKYKQFKPNENPEKYFEEIETLIKQIRTMEVEKVPAFRFWLAKIIVNYSNFGVRYIEDSKKFETKFNEVAKNFTGLVKDAYLTSLILNDKYNQYSSDYLNTYFEICNNDGFKEKISEINNQRNWKSNETLLKTTVLKDKNNIETTWSDIIESRKGKIIYVDFWASWCGGCKINLPKIKELKKKFPDLEIVFISKDAEEAKWISSFNTWEFGDIGSHYLLNPTTELAKLLTMPSIPRGTLIDKKGKIITTYTDVANSDSLIKQINQMYSN